MDAFTDEILAPTRTTRLNSDPARDSATELVQHDEVLVDVSAYVGANEPRLAWCVVTGMAPGSASVYPYKVAIPGRGTGQYRAREILAWRRPLYWHEAFRAIRAEHP